MIRHRLAPTLAMLAAALCTTTCSDSSSVEILQIDATGALFGVAYLDNNGNGVLDGTDSALPRLDVILTASRGGATVQSATTDTTGAFRMLDVAVGSYRLSLDPGTLGDSLTAFGGGTAVTVQRGDETRVDFGVSYPVLTFSEIRAGPVGRRVFTSGIALNPRPTFSDGVVHFQADSTYLRTLNVARATLNTGDSVRLLGRTKMDNGQMVLDQVTPFILVGTAQIPIPKEQKTGTSAKGGDAGSLDAALVRLRAAEISDTSTVDGTFRFRVDDGSGKVEVVLRPFLAWNTSVLRPDTILRMREATGLLVPLIDETGAVHWQLVPRGGADLILEAKQVDLSVAVTASDSTLQKGDTVTLFVALANGGPLGASGVQVVDTVPVGLTFVDATSTRGAYSSTTRIWALDSLAAGAKDTLRIRATVTTDLVGTTVHRARVKAPLKQVDTNASNDVATVIITIELPTPTAPAPSGRRR